MNTYTHLLPAGLKRFRPLGAFIDGPWLSVTFASERSAENFYAKAEALGQDAHLFLRQVEVGGAHVVTHRVMIYMGH